MKTERKHGSPLRWAVSYDHNNAITEKWYIMADTDTGTLLPMYFGKRELSIQGEAEAAIVVTVEWTRAQSNSPEMQSRLWNDCMCLIKVSHIAHYNANGNLAIFWNIIDA